MDDFVRAALLGLVQALTEFLPISSSGHLVVAAELFGDELNDLTFDVGLHLGTTAAVLLYFRRDWALFATSMQRDLRTHGGRVGAWRPHSRLALLIALGSLPAFAVGAGFQLALEDGLREPVLVGVMLIAVGLVILVLDRAAQTRGLDDLGARGALLIGVAQAAALVPGVSRSGATIAAARGIGLQREAAARFSFLLSAPVVVGAGVVLLGEALLGNEEVAWGPLLFGALVAAAMGLAVIRWLLAFVRGHSLAVFVWYRLAAGVAVLAGVQAGVL